ncbi:voltage-dependent anion channel [Fomes fomentarius]|nr:voltage-dependent anion channel [Fomes fomentarius]
MRTIRAILFSQSMTSREIHRNSLKNCVRHFSPAWYATIMGTGSIALLLHNFPYANDWQVMQVLTWIFFFLNLALFVLFNALTIARHIMFPDMWGTMMKHPTQSLYIGTYPMGGATLITVAAGFIYEQYGFGGKTFLYIIWAIWWLDVFVSLLCAFVLVHLMKTRQQHALHHLTARWLLPVVTPIVISSSGGVIARSLARFSPSHSLLTLTVSAVIVSIGLALALMILTMYLLRLIIYGIPSGTAVLSVFMPLGPMGQSAYSILLLGEGFRSALPLADGKSQVLRQANVGEIISVLGVCTALVLWSLATMWLIYGLLAIVEVVQMTRIPFQQSFWGLIFPNGVYANLTIQLYREFDSTFFRVWGAIYAVGTMFLWTWVFVRTLTMVRNGAIFNDLGGLEDADATSIRSLGQESKSTETIRINGVREG